MLLVPLLAAANALAQTPIRQGLGFDSAILPAFSDQHLLSAIKTSVENSGVNPIFTITMTPKTLDQVQVSVRGAEKSANFVCTVDGAGAVCAKNRDSATSTSSTLLTQHVEIPFGNIKAYGFKSHDEAFSPGVAEWVAIAVVSVYAAKKILNKFTTGKFLASQNDHSHFFLQPAEMRSEMASNKTAMENALAKAANNLESDLLHVAAPLVAAAGCGHDHHRDHDRHHELACEGVDAPSSAEAQRSLLTAFPRMAGTIAKDFYSEILSPVIAVAKSAGDTNTRNQLLSFAELVSLRMVKERGVWPAVATGAFTVVSQVVWEGLESIVLPAGAHMFCQVGNIAILGVAASAYTAYYCLRQTAELKGLTLAQRGSVIAHVSRLNWRANQGEDANLKDLKPSEKLALSFHLLFKMVEKDVRNARNLGEISKAESRQLAARLGELKRELNLISLKAVLVPADDAELQGWLKNLADLHSSLFPKVETCEEILVQTAAS